MAKYNARTVKKFYANGYNYPAGFNLIIPRTLQDEWLKNEWIELIGEDAAERKTAKGKKRQRNAKGHFMPIVRTG